MRIEKVDQERKQNGSSGVRNDRIKDLGVTQNGIVYVTEKGEVYVAVSANPEVELD